MHNITKRIIHQLEQNKLFSSSYLINNQKENKKFDESLAQNVASANNSINTTIVLLPNQLELKQDYTEDYKLDEYKPIKIDVYRENNFQVKFLFKIRLHNIDNNLDYTIESKEIKEIQNCYLADLPKYGITMFIKLLQTSLFSNITFILPDKKEVKSSELVVILESLFNLKIKQQKQASILPLLNEETINNNLNQMYQNYNIYLLTEDKYPLTDKEQPQKAHNIFTLSQDLPFFSEAMQNFIINKIINTPKLLNNAIFSKFNMLAINSDFIKQILNYDPANIINKIFSSTEQLLQEQRANKKSCHEKDQTMLYFLFWQYNHQYFTPEIEQSVINFFTQDDNKIIAILTFSFKELPIGNYKMNFHEDISTTDLKAKIINSLTNEKITQIFSNPRFNQLGSEDFKYFEHSESFQTKLVYNNFIYKNVIALRLIAQDKLSIIFNQLAEQNIFLIIGLLENEMLPNENYILTTTESIWENYVNDTNYSSGSCLETMQIDRKILSEFIFNSLSEQNIIKILQKHNLLYYFLFAKLRNSNTIYDNLNRIYNESLNIFILPYYFLHNNINSIEDLDKKNNILNYILTNEKAKLLLKASFLNSINNIFQLNDLFKNDLLPLMSEEQLTNLLVDDDYFIKTILQPYLGIEDCYFSQETLFNLSTKNKILRDKIFPLIINNPSLLTKIMTSEFQHSSYIENMADEKSFFQFLLPHEMAKVSSYGLFESDVPILAEKEMTALLIKNKYFIEFMLKPYLNSYVNVDLNDVSSFNYSESNHSSNTILFRLNDTNLIIRDKIFSLLIKNTSLLFKIMKEESRHQQYKKNIENEKSFFKLLLPDEIARVKRNMFRQLARQEKEFALLNESYKYCILKDFNTLVNKNIANQIDYCFDKDNF